MPAHQFFSHARNSFDYPTDSIHFPSRAPFNHAIKIAHPTHPPPTLPEDLGAIVDQNLLYRIIKSGAKGQEA
ncbi:unnamed protein product [Allacma fusca]|uniref:Uncharacterized protein n=1 Tax=Allacma fusca TaxID=39272 RepID=A0A8J2L2D8_9HEXA|nr:unnamed protein product [Allacma fusca]